jgi:imidazolonepropionase-like amidohydrolase
VPAGATIVNLAGKTIMPTLIDTHTHLSQTREGLTQDLKRRAYYGVSAALSMGTADTTVDLEMRGASAPGMARVFTAWRGITRPEVGRGTAPFWINSEQEGRKAVQELAARKVDIVKVWVDDRDGKYAKMTPALYGAVIDEAHKDGLRVTAHIFTLEDAKGLLRAGVDAFAHSVRDRDVDDEFMALVKQHPNLVVNPNLPDRGVKTDVSWLRASLPAAEMQRVEQANTDRPKAQEFYGIQARNLAKLSAAGVRIILGTDGVGAARGDGRHGCCRHDSGAGYRGGDQERGRVPAHDRRRHAGNRQERRFHRARCQSLGRYHQHAAHRGGVPAGRGRGSHEGALTHSRRNPSPQGGRGTRIGAKIRAGAEPSLPLPACGERQDFNTTLIQKTEVGRV